MTYHPSSGCDKFIGARDGHDRCVSCLGIKHAYVAFMEGSFSTCKNITLLDLWRRVLYLQEHHPPFLFWSPVKFEAAKLWKADFRITVLNRSAGLSSGFQHPDPRPEVPLETGGTCSMTPSSSFGPHEDSVSVAASEGALSISRSAWCGLYLPHPYHPASTTGTWG